LITLEEISDIHEKIVSLINDNLEALLDLYITLEQNPENITIIEFERREKTKESDRIIFRLHQELQDHLVQLTQTNPMPEEGKIIDQIKEAVDAAQAIVRGPRQ